MQAHAAAVDAEQFYGKSSGIGQRDPGFAETRRRLGALDSRVACAIRPSGERLFRNREARAGDLAGTKTRNRSGWPREKRQQRTWSGARIAEIKMIGGGIVEVHRTLHQAHSHEARVEIQSALRVARERRHMMQTQKHCLQFGKLEVDVENAG